MKPLMFLWSLYIDNDSFALLSAAKYCEGFRDLWYSTWSRRYHVAFQRESSAVVLSDKRTGKYLQTIPASFMLHFFLHSQLHFWNAPMEVNCINSLSASEVSGQWKDASASTRDCLQHRNFDSSSCSLVCFSVSFRPLETLGARSKYNGTWLHSHCGA